MTLRLFDGFDAYVTGGSEWPNDSLWGTAAAVGGITSNTRFGRGDALQLSFGVEKIFNHGNNDAQVVVGVPQQNQDGGAVKCTFCTFYDGATKQCTIDAEADGSIVLRRGDATGTIVAQTAPGLFTAGVLNFDGFAFRVKFSATVGEFQVWKNGASVYTSASNLNNISTANAYSNKFSLGPSNGSFHQNYDDVYYIAVDGVVPNAFPGDATVYTLFPSGAGSSTQWTPVGAGTNWQAAGLANSNEDSRYVSDGTVGHLDEYMLDDLPGGFLGTIIAVQGNVRARKDDAGTRQVAIRMNSGGTTQDGTTLTCTGSYATQRDSYLKNWNGNVDWVASAVNALKAGPRVIA